MKRTGLTTRHWLTTLALTTAFWAAPAIAQTTGAPAQDPGTMQSAPAQSPVQSPAQSQDQNSQPQENQQMQQNGQMPNNNDARSNDGRNNDPRDNDITRREVVNMGQFLKAHPEIAEQLQKDPKLIDNQRFVNDHPQLHQFLAEHPHVREQFDEHPYAFMRDEDRLYRDERGNGNGNDITRREVATMNGFLNDHHEIAEQLQKDPKLIDNQKYVDNHPELHAFLADHPEVRQQFDEHPDAFMKDEDRYQRWDHGKNDVPSATTPPKTAAKVPGSGSN